MTTDIFWFYLQNRLIQTSQTGGQWYSDTSASSIPWLCLLQGILKGEVSQYRWPPVWMVWNHLYDNRHFFVFAKQTNPNQSNRRSMVQWYFPLQYSLIMSNAGNTKGGSIIVLLTFCLTGLESTAWLLTFFFLQNRLIKTSQTGGELYSSTSPFSIPWYNVLQRL
jgi:hypothetical protein